MPANQSELSTDVEVDSSQIPLVTNEQGEKILRVYWLDAFEDQYKNPGVVYPGLFRSILGKRHTEILMS
ncbi:hypothetical protein DPMN_133102 [Dreissena polymorpha]|uniref:Uncharacterized protein n=1 Tax=Dreissena polymorpha TaxID=45954 RepID=A0A9D4FZI3_DREPO|nr:hypothetical protein DPMN_133102 [Dreissena polymorpha]